MEMRDEFFTTQRRYLSALSSADRKARVFRRDEVAFQAENKRISEEYADEFDACAKYTDVECPDPTYPDAPKPPSFTRETKDVRGAATEWEELRARVASRNPSPEFATLHTQLLASVETFEANAKHNADVLDQAVTADQEGYGSVDQGKLRSLRRRESGLPTVREMNRAALAVIRKLDLPVREYDVPGGRDLDSADDSTRS
jgi:hypothetical protein